MLFFISHEHVLKIKRPLIEHNYNGISNTLEIPCICIQGVSNRNCQNKNASKIFSLNLFDKVGRSQFLNSMCSFTNETCIFHMMLLLCPSVVLNSTEAAVSKNLKLHLVTCRRGESIIFENTIWMQNVLKQNIVLNTK